MRTIFFLSFFFLGTVFFSQSNSVSAEEVCPGICAEICTSSETSVSGTNCIHGNTCCVSSAGSATVGSGTGGATCYDEFGTVVPCTYNPATGTGTGTGNATCYDPFGAVVPCTYNPATGTSTGTGTGTSTTGTTVCPANFVNKSGVCFPDTSAGLGLSDVSVFDLITKVMNWLLGILGVLGVIAFVISGMQYLLSAGDENLAETAKRNMTYAIIGLAIALTGLIVVNAIAGLTGAGGGTVIY